MIIISCTLPPHSPLTHSALHTLPLHTLPPTHRPPYTLSPPTDDHHFITSTQWRSTSAIIVVGLDTGNVCRITPNNGAWVVHTVKHGVYYVGVLGCC